MRIIRFERPTLILFLRLLLDTVTVIADFCPRPVPAYISVGRLPLAVNQYFHTFIVKRIRLTKIEHIETNLTHDYIIDSEEEPLRVAASINIVLKQHVIVVFSDLGHCGEVSRFKPAFKHKGSIVRAFALVERFKIYFDKLLLLWVSLIFFRLCCLGHI